jgi:hypothetical protein
MRQPSRALTDANENQPVWRAGISLCTSHQDMQAHTAISGLKADGAINIKSPHNMINDIFFLDFLKQCVYFLIL